MFPARVSSRGRRECPSATPAADLAWERGPYPCIWRKEDCLLHQEHSTIMQYETSQLLLKQHPVGSAAVIIFFFPLCVRARACSCSLTFFNAFTSSCSAAQNISAKKEKRNEIIMVLKKTCRNNQNDCLGEGGGLQKHFYPFVPLWVQTDSFPSVADSTWECYHITLSIDWTACRKREGSRHTNPNIA